MSIQGINNEVTTFETGAVRDIQEDKGRCDLMPLQVVGNIIVNYRNNFLMLHRMSENDLILNIFKNLDSYIYCGNASSLYDAICDFIVLNPQWEDCVASDKIFGVLLDVSKHYKEGLLKYGSRNWEKGIPLHSFIDSATRHLIKWLAHYEDEKHDIAFLWNLMGCLWTHKNLDIPSLQDLPFCIHSQTNFKNKNSKELPNKSISEDENNDISD